MALTRQQYEQHIIRLEDDARSNPSWYELRLALLVTIGFLIIPVAILGSLILALLSLVTLALRTGYVVGFTIRIALERIIAFSYALRLPVSPPCGIMVLREQTPQLYALLDELCAKLHAPKPHRILLVEEFTAGVTQIPRMGLLGWQHNYLMIGLPLLQVLTTDQFTAVLAHEMAHLCGYHSRFFLWIVRVHQAWHRFMEKLEDNPGARFGLNWFFNRYIPLLEPHAFVISRLHEITADRVAADITGRRNYADAFVKLIVYKARMEEHLKSTWERADTEITPPADMYTAMLSDLHVVPTTEMAENAIHDALARTNDFLDPHPSDAERLAVLGYPPRQQGDRWLLPAGLSVPLPPAPSAAEALLGPLLTQLAREMDDTWWLANLDTWRKRHKDYREARAILEAHTASPDAEVPQDEDAMIKRALAVLNVSGEDAAIPLLEEICADNPQQMACRYLLGQILFARGNIVGIDHLRYIMEHDDEHALQACTAIQEFFIREGRAAEADAYADWARNFLQMTEAAELERQVFKTTSKYRLHDWTPEEVQQLCDQLAMVPNVQRAYLVCKEVILLPQRPCYILAVTPKRALRIFELSSDRQLMETMLRLLFPKEAMIVLLTGTYLQLEKPIAAIPGAVIYEKSPSGK